MAVDAPFPFVRYLWTFITAAFALATLWLRLKSDVNIASAVLGAAGDTVVVGGLLAGVLNVLTWVANGL